MGIGATHNVTPIFESRAYLEREIPLATSQEVIIQHEVGLHARPAALFAKRAAQYASAISIENMTKGSQPVNAKSMLRLLSASIQMNDQLRITADGDDEQAAVKALCELIKHNFQETE